MTRIRPSLAAALMLAALAPPVRSAEDFVFDPDPYDRPRRAPRHQRPLPPVPPPPAEVIVRPAPPKPPSGPPPTDRLEARRARRLASKLEGNAPRRGRR